MIATPIQRAADDLVALVPASAPSGARPPAGAVVGVATQGSRTLAASGWAALEPEPQLAMTPDALHDLASVSKVVGTTAAILRLVSEGLLDLDTAVTRIVPTFSAGSEPTIRSLLQHRAGLWEWQPLYLAPGAVDDAHSVVDSLEPRYRPGSGRHYSDLGFLYLGRIVEAVTGSPLPQAFRDLVFEPLGLTATTFAPVGRPAVQSSIGDRAERTMVATGEPYPVRWPDQGFGWREHPLAGEANDGNAFHAFGGIAGHAGLFSTVDDLLTFATALSRYADHPDLWDAEVAREFFAAGPDSEQALGFRRTTVTLAGERLPLLWHPGFTGCAVGFVPDRDLAVAFASNRLLGGDVPVPTALLWDRVLDAATLDPSPEPMRTP